MDAQTVSLTAPTGYVGGEYRAANGVRYAIVAGVCVVPVDVAPQLLAVGFVPTWVTA